MGNELIEAMPNDSRTLLEQVFEMRDRIRNLRQERDVLRLELAATRESILESESVVQERLREFVDEIRGEFGMSRTTPPTPSASAKSRRSREGFEEIRYRAEDLEKALGEESEKLRILRERHQTVHERLAKEKEKVTVLREKYKNLHEAHDALQRRSFLPAVFRKFGSRKRRDRNRS